MTAAGFVEVKFGSLTGKQFYSSSQDLFNPSQRKDSFGIVLAYVCRQVGLVLLQDLGSCMQPMWSFV